MVDEDVRSEDCVVGLRTGNRPPPGAECLAEAAATLRCQRTGHASYPGVSPRHVPAFESALVRYQRAELARETYDIQAAWQKAPPARPSSLKNSVEIVGRAVASARPEAAAEMRSAMKRVAEYQGVLTTRVRSLLMLGEQARVVLRTTPPLLLALLDNPDATGVFADALDTKSAVNLQRTCRSLRTSKPIAGRVPHLIFDAKGWGGKNNGIYFGVNAVFGVEAQDGYERVAASRFFPHAPVLCMTLHYDAPGYPKVGNVSDGSPVALPGRSDRVHSWCSGEGAQQTKIRAGVSSYSDRGRFADELQSVVEHSTSEHERTKAQRMRDRNAQKQLFRLRVHFRVLSKQGAEVRQSCLSPPFAVGKKRVAPLVRASRAKSRRSGQIL